MTLKQSQVNNLYSYLYSEYSKKLNKLETERINKIRESEEYKTLFGKFETFYTEVGLSIEDTQWERDDKVLGLLKAYKNCINSWTTFTVVQNKLRAILSTLPQDTDFEDVVKLVDEKLHLEEIISEHTNE